jgi:hypothetical protein
MSATSLSLTLPPGPIGVTIASKNSRCVVTAKSNASSSPLQVNDTILSINGITLSTVAGGLDTWKSIFATMANGVRTLVVERGVGYAQQPSEEEKKDEFDPLPTSYASVTAKKPPPLPSSLSPIRKSSRKRISTTITVGGHIIKRSNNYTVTGMNYVHGAYTADDDTTESNKKQRVAAKLPSSTSVPKKPRTRPTHELHRLSHNESLRKRMVLDESSRLEFMTRHSSTLEPFLDDKVKLLLEANHQVVDGKQPSSVDDDDKIVLGSQPDIVQTQLRDYQMVGVEWMVRMHGRGMPFILGDEMGLGECCCVFVLYCDLNLICIYLVSLMFLCLIMLIGLLTIFISYRQNSTNHQFNRPPQRKQGIHRSIPRSLSPLRPLLMVLRNRQTRTLTQTYSFPLLRCRGT